MPFGRRMTLDVETAQGIARRRAKRSSKAPDMPRFANRAGVFAVLPSWAP